MIRFNSFNYGSLLGYGKTSSSSSFYSNLSQLTSIKSGAYGKALRAYYSKNSDNSTQKTSAKSTKNSKTNAQEVLNGNALSTVKNEASELSASVKKLSDTGKEGLFQSKDNYDADAAYKAVSDFVSNYNDTVSSGA